MPEHASGPMPPEREPQRAAVRVSGIAREAALITFAVLVYFGVRNATAGSAETAFANAERLVGWERWLGIDWEGALQGAVVGSDAVVTLANWVYIFGHWPVILTVAVLLYVYRRPHYRLLRNAMFASGLIGFLFFALFPVAPPRLLELGLVDTVTERSDAYRALQPPGLTNQYAAFPSLHAGWNLLVGIVVVLAVASLGVRLLAVAGPVLMSVAVVLTANHFVLDVVGGVGVVLVGLAIAVFARRRELPATLTRDGVPADVGDARRPERRVAVRGRAPRGQLPGGAG